MTQLPPISALDDAAKFYRLAQDHAAKAAETNYDVGRGLEFAAERRDLERCMAACLLVIAASIANQTALQQQLVQAQLDQLAAARIRQSFERH